MEIKEKLIPVILCGGAGSRLWPLSQTHHPKCFIPLSDGETLLEKTYARARSLPEIEEVFVLTQENLAAKTQSTIGKCRFILEPERRNTGPAIIALTQIIAEEYGADAVILILPSDHVIEDETAWAEAVSKAVVLAKQGSIALIGVSPLYAETGYGYIQYEDSDVVKFIEKPPLKDAESYIAAGDYLWNAGIFCFKPSVMRQELKGFNFVRRTDKNGHIYLDKIDFSQLPNLPIDRLVIEKSQRLKVVKAEMGWQDIGSWPAFGSLFEKDQAHNIMHGNVKLKDTKHSHIHSSQKPVAVIGVENLLIVDTPEALLVADHTRTAEVKEFAEYFETATKTSRPWGHYTVIQERPGFKIKQITVMPGQAISYQMHKHRSEHWVVASGTATILHNDKTFTIKANESAYIEAGHWHRLQNLETEELVIIEVQIGNYLEEDDIIRKEP